MPTEAVALYNEIEPYAVAWLRNLIALGELPDGEVDERSIVDVRGDDLAGCDELHFFAGIGVWARAVAEAEAATGHRLARPLFTGSCPCQPLSTAGQRKGHIDERHLWPAFHRLIAERRPATILGEQVASKDGREWMAAVRHDLEASGYAVGTAILPAGGFGAPHIRYRLFFVANAQRRDQWGQRGEPRSETGSRGSEAWSPHGNAARSSSGMGVLADAGIARRRGREIDAPEGGRDVVCDGGATGGLADAPGGRRQHEPGQQSARIQSQAIGGRSPAELGGHSAGAGRVADAGRQRRQQVGRGASGDEEAHGRARWDGREPNGDHQLASHDAAGGVADAEGVGWRRRLSNGPNEEAELCQSSGISPGASGQRDVAASAPLWPHAPDSFWSDADWIFCRDGKWRPIEPGSFPLVDGSAFSLGSGGPYEGMSRAGMLRGYGNAVVLPVARAFVECAMEALDGH